MWLEDAYRQLRKSGLEPNEAVQCLITLLCQWPSWIRYVGFRGKVTWRPLQVDFWQNELGSASLAVGIDATDDDCLLIHFTDQAHPSVSDGAPQFYVRRRDVKREIERLSSTTAASPSTAAVPAVSEVATQDVSREGVDSFNTGADSRPTAINQPMVTPTRKKRQSKKETRVIEILRNLDSKYRVQDGMEPAEVEKIVKPHYSDVSRRVIYRAYKKYLKEPPGK
jgi:hypothetical protein